MSREIVIKNTVIDVERDPQRVVVDVQRNPTEEVVVSRNFQPSSPTISPLGPKGPKGNPGDKGDKGDKGDRGVSQGGGTLIFNQLVPSANWIIQHDLGMYPPIFTEDSSGEPIIGDISYSDANTAIVSFSNPEGGKAFITL